MARHEERAEQGARGNAIACHVLSWRTARAKQPRPSSLTLALETITIMQVLYLDNIRGFSDAAVPIRDVTFLVGENSTGKSTVLALLHIVNSYTFWNEPEFDSESHNLGGFSDLLSSNSSNRDTFTLGLAKFHDGAARNHAGLIFVSFESDEGLPVAKTYSYISGEDLVTVRRSKEKYQYRIIKRPRIDTAGIVSVEYVRAVAALHGRSNDFVDMDIPGRFPPRDFLFFSAQLIPHKEKSKVAPPFPHEFMHFMHAGEVPVWIAPIRMKPKRTYDGARGRFSADGNHTPYLLRKNLTQKRRSGFHKALAAVGKDGNLFDSIAIKRFGDSDGDPFEVHAVFGDRSHPIAHVGYGVSQALPIIAEALTLPRGTRLYVQQPEVHLHPKAQSSLGALIHSLATVESKSFVIETHSDFLIDRFRVEVRDKNVRPDCSVLFFRRTSLGNEVTEIPIESSGAYSEIQPDDFREFFIHEQYRVLGV